MTGESLVIRFTTSRSPEEAFAAVTDVRSWWTGEIDGVTDQVGGEFSYRYADIHRSTQRVTELVPGRRVAWLVTDGYLNFTADAAEWTGTSMTFDITPTPAGAEVQFTHVGLVPQAECFDQCSPAWTYYIGTSLRERIAAGPVTLAARAAEKAGD